MAYVPRSKRTHRSSTYRSGLEERTGKNLKSKGIQFEFESFKIPFVQPAKHRKYTPDFILLKNYIIIETKGEFSSDDRFKHRWIKEQHPGLDIRFVFSNARAKIRKGSKTTHAMWAEKYGFKWAHKEIPKAWLDEEPDPEVVKAVEAIRKG